jgi:hypothetical protein
VHRTAVEACIRHLDDHADLHTAHALLTTACEQAPTDSAPESCADWGLCALLAMAMEHPSMARLSALPTYRGRAAL